MKYTYKTNGTCSPEIYIDVENDIILSVKFFGGCDGNSKGIAALVTGMKTQEVIERLKTIKCSNRNTSCPDQLARALMEYKAQQIIKGD